MIRLNNWRRRVFVPATMAARFDDRGFPEVTPHDLRHTAASLAISAGANVKAVQTMLGHASAAMTLDTYADLFPDDLEWPRGSTRPGPRPSGRFVSKACPDTEKGPPPHSAEAVPELAFR